MRHHLIAASLSLLVAACGYDYPTTLALPDAPVAAPPVRAPTSPGTWSHQTLPLISHAGRRFVVIASNLDDTAAEGPIRVLQRDDLVVTERAPVATAVPDAWRAREHSVRALTHGGARCTLRVGAPTVLSRVALDPGTLDAWNGRDPEGNAVPRRADEAIAQEAYDQSGGGRVLAAEVLDDGCADASWAQAHEAPVVRFAAEPADDATRRAALAQYRASSAWQEQQSLFREYATDAEAPPSSALWDESHHAPEVTTWRAPQGHRTFVTVRGEVPFAGCGVFSGAVWAVFERDGDRLIPRSGAELAGDFVPAEVVDADGDGAPEFLSVDEVRALGPSGYEPVLSTAFPYLGCRC